MKILVVTGMMAEKIVRRYSTEAAADVDVLALPVSVAAFITPRYAARALTAKGVKGYDMILVPGSVQGDVSPIEAATKIPTYKGPIHAADIPHVISLIEEIALSKTVPASELMRALIEERAILEIGKVERNWRRLLREQGGMVVGSEERLVPVGPAFPMRIIAEIVNAPVLQIENVIKRARYYEAEGADIIDIGMLAGRPMPGKVEAIIEAVRNSVNLPISIDTLEPSEIEVAVDNDIDLILSVDSGNMDEVASFVSNTPAVVLPSNMKEGLMPRFAEKRVEALMKNIHRARELGIMNIIADPVLEPPLNPGLMESLKAYQIFRQKDEETPVLFGLGNVTELMDVDSTGVNGLLTAIAQEVGSNLIFTPEFSTKAMGSVRELAAASKMMFLGDRKGTTPKDLGIDLLRLKEKRWREIKYNKSVEEGVKVIKADREERFASDMAGWFKIEVDREEGLIAANHYPFEGKEQDVIIKGLDARGVYLAIIGKGLVSKLDHAAYLGKELAKAEMALRLGRAYIQDEKLFP